MPRDDVDNTRNTRMNTGDYYVPLYGHRRREGPLRPAPVDAFEQHRQLRPCQQDRAARGLRPDEMSAFQTLLKQTQAVAIEPQNLDRVAAASAEDEHMAGVRLHG